MREKEYFSLRSVMGTAGSHPLGDSSAQRLTNGEKACGRGASSGMGSLSHPHPFCSVRRTASIRYPGADIVSRPSVNACVMGLPTFW